MTDKARIRIAAGATVTFLAAISALGLATQSNPPQATPAVATAPAPAAQAFTARERDDAQAQREESGDE